MSSFLPAQKLVDERTKFLVNPTGRFVVGGPHGDSGLTGRKIICDTYGGYARHGGGAFSGKDPTKVDRSAAYAARHIAKNVVASGLAESCEIQLAYAIGVARPVSIMVDTFTTGVLPDDKIAGLVTEKVDLRPEAIIERLGLRAPFMPRPRPTAISAGRTWTFLGAAGSFALTAAKAKFHSDYGSGGERDGTGLQRSRSKRVERFKMARYVIISPNPEDDVIAHMEKWAENSGLLQRPDYVPKRIGWDFPFVSKQQQEKFGLRGYVCAYVIPEDFEPACPGRNWRIRLRTITRPSP